MGKLGYIWGKTYDIKEQPVLYSSEMPEPEATFAMQMLERWGMVAAMDDGEDSAGRQKIRVATPEELVWRACTVAEVAFAEFDRRGWMLKLPPPKIGKDA